MSNITVANWGNFPRIKSEVTHFFDTESLRDKLLNTSCLIARGYGRSYGDASLNTNQILDTSFYNDFILFNRTTGELIVEAGASVETVLNKTVPFGWFLPVVPGTKYVSIGGAIAANIHGKNHHVSRCFSNHINWICMMLADGSIVRCSSLQNSELFNATCGGQGLTGFILYASIQLVKYETSVIKQKNSFSTDLNDYIEQLERSNKDSEYTVGWCDLASRSFRGLVFSGDFISNDELETFSKDYLTFGNRKSKNLIVPFYTSSAFINKASILAFNRLYYRVNSRKSKSFYSSIESFFFPLDAVKKWNRLYGRKGFIQYQFVIPDNASMTLQKIFSFLKRTGTYSPLAVIKLCGDEPEKKGSLTFCRKGISVALDFKYSTRLFNVLNRLDDMIAECGGRVYLAKDSRLSALEFRQMYGKAVDDFMEIKSNYDPNNKFCSLLSERLKLSC